MLNTYLHSITNRTDNFVSGVLRDAVELPRVALPVEYTKVASLLGLDNTDTDFYVKGCLTILKAFPDVTAQLGADNPTFDVDDLSYTPAKFDGLTLVANGNTLPYAKSKVFGKVSFTYFDANTLKATQGDNVYYLPVSIGEDRIFVNWSGCDLDVRGDITTEQVWGSTFAASISIDPSVFPIAELVDTLTKSEYTNKLVNGAGTKAQFFASDLPTDKLAVILLSLGIVYQKSIQ